MSHYIHKKFTVSTSAIGFPDWCLSSRLTCDADRRGQQRDARQGVTVWETEKAEYKQERREDIALEAEKVGVKKCVRKDEKGIVREEIKRYDKRTQDCVTARKSTDKYTSIINTSRWLGQESGGSAGSRLPSTQLLKVTMNFY